MGDSIIRYIRGRVDIVHRLLEFGIRPGVSLRHIRGDLYKMGVKTIAMRLPDSVRIIYETDKGNQTGRED